MPVFICGIYLINLPHQLQIKFCQAKENIKILLRIANHFISVLDYDKIVE
jgi:hypothetical protein